jgi:hypothetical protein
MSNPTTVLIELRRHYASIVAQSRYQANQAKAQLEHIDALLLNEPMRGKTFPLIAVPNAVPSSVFIATPAQSSPLEIAQAPVGSTLSVPSPEVSSSKSYGTRTKSRAKKSRSGESLLLLPEYQGMTKLEAISRVLSDRPGRVLHQDTIIRSLYGELSADQLHLESRRMRASLFQGVKKNLWKRAVEQPSSYVVEAGGESQPIPADTKRTSSAQSIQGKAPTKAVAKPRLELLPKLTRLKPGRPPRVSALSKRAKGASKEDQPKPKQLEVVALLRKPSFAV